MRAKTGLEIWQHARAAYQNVSQELGLRLIPVGDAFQSVNSDPKWTYQKDTKFDFEKPIHPLLPLQTGSLNVGYSWKTPTNFAFDSNHANHAGCYLAGLIWYRFLFNESPAKLKFAPPEVEADFATYLRQQAAKVDA